MIRTDVKRLFVDIKDSIADAAKVIQTQPEKIALVVDEENNLLGSVTDALIRTALLAGRAVSDPLSFPEGRANLMVSQNFSQKAISPII